MSFQKVKPTKPELDRLKNRLEFTRRGKDLLKLKREQLVSRLRKINLEYYKSRAEIRTNFLNVGDKLEKTYESIGKRTVSRISTLHRATTSPDVEIMYHHEIGIDIPKVNVSFEQGKLPAYSLSNTSLYLDITINNLKQVLEKIAQLAELDHTMYQLADSYKKIQRRIDALDDIVIPKLKLQISAIEDILSDETQEEYIRMKKIKDFLD